MKQYSLDVAVAVALGLATLHAIGRPVSARIGWAMALGAIASPWFSFPAVFIVAGCGMALILTSLVSGRLRDAAVWCAIGAAWAVSFVAAYNASLAHAQSAHVDVHLLGFCVSADLAVADERLQELTRRSASCSRSSSIRSTWFIRSGSGVLLPLAGHC